MLVPGTDLPGASKTFQPLRCGLISVIVRLPCSNIPSNLGTVLVIGLTKLLLEVALLGQDNSAQHSDKERDEHDNALPRIEYQDEPNIGASALRKEAFEKTETGRM